MDISYSLLIFLVGLLAGFINTVGAGGSMLVLPILILSGLPSDLANGTNRVAIFLQTIVGVAGFKRQGHWAPKRAALLGSIALLGAIPGAFLAIRATDQWFERILALVILLMGSYLLFQKKLTGREGVGLPSWKNIRTSAPFFLIIGVYGGFVQAGVGFLLLATLTGVTGFHLARANSVKVFVVLIYTIAALAVFLWHGQVDWVKGCTLAAGNMIGGWVGSQWASKVRSDHVRYLIAGMAILLAVRLLI
ncbi:MAG: sulfite exporter TauE/SafE family protein [Flavobacteriales bacterium]